MPGHREILKTHVLIELTNPRNAKTEAAAEILEYPTSEIKVVPALFSGAFPSSPGGQISSPQLRL